MDNVTSHMQIGMDSMYAVWMNQIQTGLYKMISSKNYWWNHLVKLHCRHKLLVSMRSVSHPTSGCVFQAHRTGTKQTNKTEMQWNICSFQWTQIRVQLTVFDCHRTFQLDGMRCISNYEIQHSVIMSCWNKNWIVFYCPSRPTTCNIILGHSNIES